MSDNERPPIRITGALSVSGTVSHGKLTEELAKFFVAAWDEYCDNPCEEMEWVIQETALITTKDITEEDMAKGIAPEGHDVGDFMYVLTDLGKEAVAVFCEVNDRRKAELGVVKPQRIPNEVITHPTPKPPEDIVHTWKGIDIETMTHEELVAAFKEAGFAAIAIAKTVFVKPHTQEDAP